MSIACTDTELKKWLMYFVIRTRKIYPIYFGKIQVTNNVNIGTSGVMVYALNETIEVKYCDTIQH